MKRKRTVETSGAVTLEASASPSRRRATKPSPSYVKVEEFRRFFKDPPHAEALLEGSPVVDEGINNDQGEEPQTTSSKTKGQYQGLQFNDSHTNINRIFLAVRFLYNHLQDRAHLENDTFQFSTTKKDGGDFKTLAKDLKKEAPLLNGITGLALQSMYVQIVEKRRALQEFLERVTTIGDLWIPTKLSDMSWRLVLVDDEIQARHERIKAQEEGRHVEGPKGQETDGLEAVATDTTVEPRKGNHIDKLKASVKKLLPLAPPSTRSTSRRNQPSTPATPAEQEDDASPAPDVTKEDRSTTAPPPPSPAPPQESEHIPTLQALSHVPHVPTIPSQERDPLSDTEEQEQESFGEERVLEITRMIQDLSSEAEEKQATVETRLQSLEILIQAQQATIETMRLEKAAPLPPDPPAIETKLKSLSNLVQTHRTSVETSFKSMKAAFQNNRASVRGHLSELDADVKHIQERAENGQQGLRTALQAMDNRMKTVEKAVAKGKVKSLGLASMFSDSSDLEGRLDFLEMLVDSLNNETSDSKVMGLTRMVQDVSSEVEEKHASSETRLQTLEIKIQDMDRRMKGVEKIMKDAAKKMEDATATLKCYL